MPSLPTVTGHHTMSFQSSGVETIFCDGGHTLHPCCPIRDPMLTGATWNVTGDEKFHLNLILISHTWLKYWSSTVLQCWSYLREKTGLGARSWAYHLMPVWPWARQLVSLGATRACKAGAPSLEPLSQPFCFYFIIKFCLWIRIH
jgi:hypothetical protein